MTDLAYDPPLVHLPGTKLTPEVVLHRTLNKIDSIKSITVIIQWSNDTFDIDWSEMKTSELALTALLLNKQATDLVVK